MFEIVSVKIIQCALKIKKKMMYLAKNVSLEEEGGAEPSTS